MYLMSYDSAADEFFGVLVAKPGGFEGRFESVDLRLRWYIRREGTGLGGRLGEKI